MPATCWRSGADRSDAWLWRQVLFAVLTRTIVDVRTKPRVTIESALISFATALLAVLGFQSLVVPDPAIQTAVGMVFIAGLFVGVSSRSTCDSLPSS